MSPAIEAVAGIVGLVIGSFVALVVDRLPRHESILTPPSHCIACSASIKPYDNIPVVSYAILRGRCRACGTRTPPRDASVELATGVLFVLLAWRASSVWSLPAFCVFGAALLAISLIDAVHMRIPTAIVYATIALEVPLLVLASAGSHRWSALLGVLVAGAVAFAVFFAIYFAVPKGIGFGDVRLGGLCGGLLGWIGYREVLVGFLISILVAGIPAAVLLAMGKVHRKTRIPFGPFLAIGTLITMLFGPAIVHAWGSV